MKTSDSCQSSLGVKPRTVARSTSRAHKTSDSGFFVLFRTIIVRLLFALHGLTAIWCLYGVTREPRYWLLSTALSGLVLETTVTILVNKGHEWKWFSPSVFFYLLSTVPAIWFLEVQQMNRRIEERNNANNITDVLFSKMTNSTILEQQLNSVVRSIGIDVEKVLSEQWVRALEQVLLLLLICGRWMLPKGKLTHDQLSQLLLVYIGTAADIVEFFDAFKEKEVRTEPVLCYVILGIWSWSLMQFTIVLTASRARKDRSGMGGLTTGSPTGHYLCCCCMPDVFGIIVSIIMQDGPFLVLRMLLIFKYNVISYTNMFFTCKNTLVILLLLYRLIVVQIERRQSRKEHEKYVKVTVTNHNTDTDFNFGLDPHGPKHNLAFDDPTERPPVHFMLRPRQESFTLIDGLQAGPAHSLTAAELEAVNHVIRSIRNRGSSREEWEDYDNVCQPGNTGDIGDTGDMLDDMGNMLGDTGDTGDTGDMPTSDSEQHVD